MLADAKKRIQELEEELATKCDQFDTIFNKMREEFITSRKTIEMQGEQLREVRKENARLVQVAQNWQAHCDGIEAKFDKLYKLHYPPKPKVKKPKVPLREAMPAHLL
jgi:chromosome segregation ATPase